MNERTFILVGGVVAILLVRHFIVKWIEGDFPAQAEILDFIDRAKKFFKSRKQKKTDKSSPTGGGAN